MWMRWKRPGVIPAHGTEAVTSLTHRTQEHASTPRLSRLHMWNQALLVKWFVVLTESASLLHSCFCELCGCGCTATLHSWGFCSWKTALNRLSALFSVCPLPPCLPACFDSLQEWSSPLMWSLCWRLVQ